MIREQWVFPCWNCLNSVSYESSVSMVLGVIEKASVDLSPNSHYTHRKRYTAN